MYTSVLDSQLINGVSYNVQSAEKPYSIMKDNNIYKFEVLQGEAREGKDKGKERSELSQDEKIPYGSVIWTSFQFRISSGAKWQDIVSVNGQFHAGAGSPNLSIRVPSYNKMQIVLRYGKSDDYKQKIIHNATFKPGAWYNIVIKSIFSPGPDGFVEVWINGSRKTKQENIITGYSDCNSTYFKFGIYRSTSAPDFERVYFANVETGLKDLSGRIKKPLTLY